MKRSIQVMCAAALAMTAICQSDAATPILQPSDTIIAIDLLPNSRSAYPDGEAAKFALDGAAGTKYLNFAEIDTGILVTPIAGPTVVTGIQLTTAGDAEERDPASFSLYGTNDLINHALENNGDTTSYSWTLINQGALALPAGRETLAPLVSFANATPFNSYRVVFPTIKDTAAANSMQVAEVQLLDAGNVNVLNALDSVSAIQLPQPPNSSFPAGEPPSAILDGNSGTKYLNFGKQGTGFIVTPSSGVSVVGSLQITTANDSASRDPTTWKLYGTNDPITSVNNSSVNPENWVLIDSGAANLPLDRLTAGPLTAVDGAVSFTSYRMVFPTLRDPGAGDVDSMQIADVQFFAVPEPPALALLLTAAVCGAFSIRRRVDSASNLLGNG